MKTPLMLDTKRMAIWDGPGIRTTFFVKGCPLRCIWCHNPESIKCEAQWARFQHLCKHHAKCTMDEATCPTRALKLYGKPMTIDEIVAKALEDKAFYDESGGGVTLSGGEPLFFWEWAAELFKACKAAGLHTCLDTSLYAPPVAIDALMPVTDMWLPDYKADDDALHVKYTGVSNVVVKKNLERLVAAKAKLEVRCLVVPGCTDGEDVVARHRYLASLGIPDKSVVDLEYYDYARSKYLALGMKDTMPPKTKPRSVLRGIALAATLAFAALPGAADAATASSPAASPRCETADLLVVGGDEAACAAAVSAARMGVTNVLLVSDCEMLGGQYSAQGVGPVDERVLVNGRSVDFPRSGLALEVMEAIEAYNMRRYGMVAPGNSWSATRTIEPAAAAAIFEKLLAAEGRRVRVLRGYGVESVVREGGRVAGVRFSRGLSVRARLTVDASDWADVIRLGGARYFVGVDPKSRFGERLAPDAVGPIEAQEMNPITWTLTLRESPSARPIAKPDGYDTFYFAQGDIWRDSGVYTCAYQPDGPCVPYTQRRLVDTRHFALPACAVETIQLNTTCMDYPLCEWPEAVAGALRRLGDGMERRNFADLPPEGKRIVYDDARRRSLAYLYFLQNDNPSTVARMRKFELSDEFGTPDRLPPKPYIREGVRLAAVSMLADGEVRAENPARQLWARCPADAAFGFQFHIDFHPTRRGYPSKSRPKAWQPRFSGVRDWNGQSNRSFFPYSGFVPESVDGLLGAGRNVGISSMVQAALRLHPQMVLSGQCAGALAAVALSAGREPRAVVADAAAVRALQERMVRGIGGKPGVAIWAWQNLSPSDSDFFDANIPVVRPPPSDPACFDYVRQT